MKIKLFQFKGHWMIKRADQPHRAHVLDADDNGVLTLLAFLGMAEFRKGSWDPVPIAGEYEL